MLRYMVVVMVGLMLLGLMGCGQEAAEEDQGDWEISVVAPGVEASISVAQLRAMDQVTVRVEQGGSSHEFTGPSLRSVLESLDITEAGEVTFEAEDGYSAALEGGNALADETILALEVDGGALEEGGPVRLVSELEPPRFWVGELRLIRVE